MPKNSLIVVLKRIFLVRMGHFLPFLSSSALKLRQLIFPGSCAGFVGIGGKTHVSRGASHWFRPRKSPEKREKAKTPPGVRKSYNGQKLGN